MGIGSSSAPLAADFGPSGTSTKVARADHVHQRAFFTASTTTSPIVASSTTWTEVTTIATFNDRALFNITRSNSAFTFAQAGTYLISFTLNTYGTNEYVGYRLRRINGVQMTLLQRTNHTVGGQTPGGLIGLFMVSAGDIVNLEYAVKGATGSWFSTNPLDGETMVTGQLDIIQVN